MVVLVWLQVESSTVTKGVAHGGLYTMMLDMALGGALVSILPKQEWCALHNLLYRLFLPLAW